MNNKRRAIPKLNAYHGASDNILPSDQCSHTQQDFSPFSKTTWSHREDLPNYFPNPSDETESKEHISSSVRTIIEKVSKPLILPPPMIVDRKVRKVKKKDEVTRNKQDEKLKVQQRSTENENTVQNQYNIVVQEKDAFEEQYTSNQTEHLVNDEDSNELKSFEENLSNLKTEIESFSFVDGLNKNLHEPFEEPLYQYPSLTRDELYLLQDEPLGKTSFSKQDETLSIQEKPFSIQEKSSSLQELSSSKQMEAAFDGDSSSIHEGTSYSLEEFSSKEESASLQELSSSKQVELPFHGDSSSIHERTSFSLEESSSMEKASSLQELSSSKQMEAAFHEGSSTIYEGTSSSKEETSSVEESSSSQEKYLSMEEESSSLQEKSSSIQEEPFSLLEKFSSMLEESSSIQECLEEELFGKKEKEDKFRFTMQNKDPLPIVKLPVLLAVVNIDIDIFDSFDLSQPISNISNMDWTIHSLDGQTVLHSNNVFLKGLLVADIKYVSDNHMKSFHTLRLQVPWEKTTTIDWMYSPVMPISSNQTEYMFQSKDGKKTDFHHENHKQLADPLQFDLRSINFVWANEFNSHAGTSKLCIQGRANLIINLLQQQYIDLNSI
ncbi:hypothetical protein C0971_07350 [Bacillus methanolicus]|uniref:hypothetical protein n=1 Tax=Bacillus methanolicus TaxID=1471 RepID=UPI00200CEF9A|nr:hypothetical protein [Bacillus methanolicus]UQD51877.1 hypothetical protein C0971_07350 [Bacillus methanolicus]